jgi:hypothetical protein
MKTLWMIFYVYSHVPYSVGAMYSKADCEFVRHQLVEGLKPEKAICVEVPQQQQGN